MATVNLILEAAYIAKCAHSGQLRKYTLQPYVHHPARVAGRIGLYATQEKVVAAAYLHDVLEDTPWTYAELRDAIGTDTAVIVWELTNPSKGLTLNRAQRKEIDRKFLKDRSYEARLIKMMDRIDNLNDMLDAPRSFRQLYANESMALLEAIKWGIPVKLVREFENSARLAYESK